MKQFKEIIKAYLDKRAEEDALFKVSYDKKNKSIDGCINYIVAQARKMGGNAVPVENSVVFGWAVHYYDENNLQEAKAENVSVAMPKVELTEEDKEKMRVKALEEYKRQEIEKLEQAERERKRKIQERRAKEEILPQLF